jgi:hypothetical protein
MFIYTAQYEHVYLYSTICTGLSARYDTRAPDPARFAQYPGYGDTPADGVGVGNEQGRLGSLHPGDVETTAAVPEHVDPGVQP